jgi:hypothetical protein
LPYTVYAQREEIRYLKGRLGCVKDIATVDKVLWSNLSIDRKSIDRRTNKKR